MRKFSCVVFSFLLCFAFGHAQPGAQPFSADSLTRALWHFNETSGSVVGDTSISHNNGIAYGTTIVPGRFGNARSFNGTSDYVMVPFDSTLNFGDTSFRVDVWFKTGGTAAISALVRRGFAPVPGFWIYMHNGHICCQLGANVDPPTPDPELTIEGAGYYDDNVWHHAAMVRDRAAKRLSLYIDDTLAAPPVEDTFTLPLDNNHPLTIGRWENTSYPWYFTGSIDEVRLEGSTLIRSPLQVGVMQSKLSFGTIRVGTSKTLPITIKNLGYRDTLHINSILAENEALQVPDSQQALPPGGSMQVLVTYHPIGAGRDSGTISLETNDPVNPRLLIPFSGGGVVLGHSPIIESAETDPYTYGHVQVTWFRSVDDSIGATDPVTQYQFWGNVKGAAPSSRVSTLTTAVGGMNMLNDAWMYLGSIPAAGFDEYTTSIVQGSPYQKNYWTSCIVAAVTKNQLVFLSDPDTVVTDPPPQITGIDQSASPDDFALMQNYPNPFNPETVISGWWTVDSRVRLVVYDLLGREVTVLADGRYPAGKYAFKFDGSKLSSGMYIYRLTAGQYSAVRTMTLIK